jgi:two-component system, LytTR family, sensor kinase
VTRKGFWVAQLVWWGSYVIVFHLASLPGLADTSFHGQLIHVGQKLAKAGVGFAASLVLYALFQRWTPRMKLPVLGACTLGVCYVLGLGWEMLVRVIYIQPVWDGELLRATMLPTFTLAAWSALYFSFVYRDRANAEAARALRATALATEAELAMLRYQVNPHFLFNALNAIRALIDENPAAARTMVTQLAELFRYSLRTADDAQLTVGDEVTAIRNYLDIQRIRFERDLDAEVTLDDAAAHTRLPGFLIHPLVENAVKYGLETSERPLRVRVAVARDGDALDVTVTNSGRWLAHGSNGTGTGLRNLRARLAHLYPERHALDVGEHAGEVRAHLRVEVGG